MREWLGRSRPGSLLILDEAHHAAPSSGGRYGIETKFTRAVRDLAGRFEHRQFLSATPHNGHSTSFSTLLGAARLARSLAVRRRTVERRWDGSREAPDGAGDASAAPGRVGGSVGPPGAGGDSGMPAGALFTSAPGADDERAEWTPDENDSEDKRQVEAITTAVEQPPATAAAQPSATTTERAGGARESPADSAAPARSADATRRRERELLDRMQAVAEAARGRPDAKTRRLIDWIREHCCPDLPPFGESPPADAEPPRWTERRVLVFTENREGTKRYLRRMLEAAVAASDRAAERIATIDGLNRRTAAQGGPAPLQRTPGRRHLAQCRRDFGRSVEVVDPVEDEHGSRTPTRRNSRTNRPGGPEREPCTSAARPSSPQATHACSRPRAAAPSHSSDVVPAPGGPTRHSGSHGASGFARPTAMWSRRLSFSAPCPACAASSTARATPGPPARRRASSRAG